MLYQMIDMKNPIWHLNLNTSLTISCEHIVSYILTCRISWGGGYQKARILKEWTFFWNLTGWPLVLDFIELFLDFSCTCKILEKGSFGYKKARDIFFLCLILWLILYSSVYTNAKCLNFKPCAWFKHIAYAVAHCSPIIANKRLSYVMIHSSRLFKLLYLPLLWDSSNSAIDDRKLSCRSFTLFIFASSSLESSHVGN